MLRNAIRSASGYLRWILTRSLRRAWALWARGVTAAVTRGEALRQLKRASIALFCRRGGFRFQRAAFGKWREVTRGTKAGKRAATTLKKAMIRIVHHSLGRSWAIWTCLIVATQKIQDAHSQAIHRLELLFRTRRRCLLRARFAFLVGAVMLSRVSRLQRNAKLERLVGIVRWFLAMVKRWARLGQQRSFALWLAQTRAIFVALNTSHLTRAHTEELARITTRADNAASSFQEASKTLRTSLRASAAAQISRFLVQLKARNCARAWVSWRLTASSSAFSIAAMTVARAAECKAAKIRHKAAGFVLRVVLRTLRRHLAFALMSWRALTTASISRRQRSQSMIKRALVRASRSCLSHAWSAWRTSTASFRAARSVAVEAVNATRNTSAGLALRILVRRARATLSRGFIRWRFVINREELDRQTRELERQIGISKVATEAAHAAAYEKRLHTKQRTRFDDWAKIGLAP